MVHLHWMQQQTSNGIMAKKGREELDEFTFIEWKNELQRNLPDFWDFMNQT